MTRWRRGNSPAETDLSELKWLSADEISGLRRDGLGTVEALCERIARNGFDATVDPLEVSPRTVRRALARHALREGAGRTRSGLARARGMFAAALPEALLVGAAVLLAVLGVRAVGVPERHVVATRDLPAFHLVAPADVEARAAHADFGTLRSGHQAAGRILLRAVAAGEPLSSAGLSRVRFPDPRALHERRIVSLAVVPHTLRLAVPAGRADLVLSPRGTVPAGGADHALVRDVIVLDVRETADAASVVVAVRDADAPVLGRLLGRSDVYVVQPVRPSPGDP